MPFVMPASFMAAVVGQSHVAVEAVDKNRIIGRYRIDELMAGQLSGFPVLMVPVAAENPFAFGAAPRESCDTIAKLGCLFASRS